MSSPRYFEVRAQILLAFRLVISSSRDEPFKAWVSNPRPEAACVNCVCKRDKAHSRTIHEGPESEWRFTSTLSLTWALDGDRWSTLLLGHLTPGKETRYPSYRRLGWPQGRSERVRKTSLPLGFDPGTVQSVTSHCIDWAIPAHKLCIPYKNYTVM